MAAVAKMSGSRAKKAHTSAIWNYFRVHADDESFVKCCICKDKLSRGGKKARSFSTTTMISHLRSKHAVEFTAFEQAKSALLAARCELSLKRAAGEHSSAATATKLVKTWQSQSIEDCLARKTLFDADDPRQIAITRLIAEMIARDCQPFSIVEDDGFCKLLTTMEPRFKMPSRSHLSRTLIPQMYCEVREKMQSQVNKLVLMYCN
jgi:hypothetical protein